MGISKYREQDLVKDCLTLLAANRCFCWRQNQGALRAIYKGKSRLIRFASIEGISDIIGVSPTGQFVAIECKQPGNVPTPHQAAFLSAVAERGGIALVIHSVEELQKEIESWS